MTVHSAQQISELLAGREHIPSSSDRSWRNWTFEKFYEKLLSCFAESTQTNILTKLLTAIGLDPETYSLDVLANGDTSISGYITLSTALENLLDIHGALGPDKAINSEILTPANNQNLANFLFRLIRVDDQSTAHQSTPRLHFKQRLLALNKKRNNREDFESIEQFKDCLVRTDNERSNAQCEAGGFGLIPSAFPPAVSASFMLDEANYMQVHGSSSGGIHPHVSQQKPGKGSHKGNSESSGPRNQNLNNLTQGTGSIPCKGCGWTDTCSSQTQCQYKAHPGYNSEANTWASSTNGRAYKVANIANKGTDKKGKDKLCFYFHPNGNKLSEGEIQKLKDSGMKKPAWGNRPSSGNKRQQNNHGEKTNYEPLQILASYTTTKDDSYLRPFTILTSKQEVGVGKATTREADATKIELNALIDTGAIHSSYVNFETAKKLQKLGLLYIPSNKRVCTGLNNASCTNVSKAYDIELTFLNELTNKKELLIIRAQVIDSRYDLIIGYPDIFNFELTSKFPSLFSKSWIENKEKNDLRKQVDYMPIMQASDGSCSADCSCSLQVTNPISHEPTPG